MGRNLGGGVRLAVRSGRGTSSMDTATPRPQWRVQEWRDRGQPQRPAALLCFSIGRLELKMYRQSTADAGQAVVEGASWGMMFLGRRRWQRWDLGQRWRNSGWLAHRPRCWARLKHTVVAGPTAGAALLHRYTTAITPSMRCITMRQVDDLQF